MSFVDDSTETAVAFAGMLADKARAISLAGFRQDLDIALKSDKSPVTAIDRDVESMVRDMVARSFPGHGFLGEEFASVNLTSDNVWVVDPIDGTRSFITGWPIWGTLIAKLVREQPSLGVIDMPALDERWIGIRGGACTFSNGGSTAACRVSECRSLDDASFYTTNILYFGDADRRKVEAILHRAAIPRFGGDCYSYGLLASGHVDLVIESDLEPYDFLALVPVVESAGGIITDWAGRPLNRHSGKQVVAAATAELHRQALAMLR
ncbi:MAG: histidinol-phosphatase [Roseovarius sp.]|nr:histidinol-phosphatase [Roseovarius sp.]